MFIPMGREKNRNECALGCSVLDSRYSGGGSELDTVLSSRPAASYILKLDSSSNFDGAQYEGDAQWGAHCRMGTSIYGVLHLNSESSASIGLHCELQQTPGVLSSAL
jgi:hypothetical protein